MNNFILLKYSVFVGVLSSADHIACAARVLTRQCGKVVARHVAVILRSFASSPQSCASVKRSEFILQSITLS